MPVHDYLYDTIAETFRRQILSGEIKTGERLPSVRSVAGKWACTIGSVQKAFQQLSDQGLVSSRAGQGTFVVYGTSSNQFLPFRRVNLLHRSEAFLLEVLGAGYEPVEIEETVREGLDRFRVIRPNNTPAPKNILRFNGSHDLAIAWIASHFKEIAPGWVLELNFTGSLRGLMALENNQAEIAGCHLWDEETNSYNLPFIQKLLPGKHLEVVTLCTRSIGLMVAPGNPMMIRSLEDLARPGLKFLNRQDGSGIRVWLDAQIRKLGISSAKINGYADEVSTHSEVALAIAEKRVDAGIGIEAAAGQYGLDFLPLTKEQYDLVFPELIIHHPAVVKLLGWLAGTDARKEIAGIPGYEVEKTGNRYTIK